MAREILMLDNMIPELENQILSLPNVEFLREAIAVLSFDLGRSPFYSPYSDKNTRKSLKAALVFGELSS